MVGVLELLWPLPGTARIQAKLSHPFRPLVMSVDLVVRMLAHGHLQRHGQKYPDRQGSI